MPEDGPGPAQAKAGKSKKTTDQTVTEAIGRQLKSAYDEVLTEPVPQELSDLVARLAKESGSRPKNR